LKENRNTKSSNVTNGSKGIRSYLSSTAPNDSGDLAPELQERCSFSIVCLRVSTFLTLVSAAVIVAALTFHFVRSSEIKSFELEYNDAVHKVEDAVILGMKNKLNAAKTFAAIYETSFTEWPNATFTNAEFDSQAQGQLEIANGMAISFNPIIDETNRVEFEQHAADSASLLGHENLVTRSCDDDSGSICRIVTDGIYRKAPNPNGSGLINVNDPGFSPESTNYPNTLVPVWQIYPISNWRAVMFNLHSEQKRQRALDNMLDFNLPTVTSLLHLVQDDELNPSSILFYPVTRNVDSDEIVGSISIVFYWGDIFRRVLPSYIEGITVVLESSRLGFVEQQQWSYDVSGNIVTLLGEGDLHDTRFDNWEHEVNIDVAKIIQDKLGNIGQDRVKYTVRMYPTSKFKGKYLSQRPMVMTIIIVCIFIFTSLVFISYDLLATNKRHRIKRYAKKAGKVVNNLFPSNVRDRLFDNFGEMNDNDHEGDEEAQLKTPSKVDAEKKRKATLKKIKSMVGGVGRERSVSTINSDISETDLLNPNRKPIADRFDATSIMFADIVGFTKWCSEHSPEEVFFLIENLFYAWDKIAKRMGVFKLDRVGDCYIAVTGLPTPTEHHAEILCEFAHECRNKMFEVMEKISAHLQGIDELTMRFGIHSGAVTAGVLKGQKTRFELFGDTMNYASRMESLCLPGRIQVSQQTADLLFAAGKSEWLRARKSFVHAKGKGKVQTYWLEIDGCGNSGHSHSSLEVEDSPLGIASDSFLDRKPAARPTTPKTNHARSA
jgi:class 3 adenylate cyclase